MSGFNNEDYDGLVLNIPSWFINLNNLSTALESLRIELAACDKSIHHPDHIRNLYELDNMVKKKSIVEAKKNSIRASKGIQEANFNRIINGEEYELFWEPVRYILDSDTVRLPDESFGFNDYFTNKLNVKSSFVKNIKAKVNTLATFENFAESNCRMIKGDLILTDPNFIDLDYSFYCSNYNANLSISYRRLYVKYNYRKFKQNYKYSTGRLLRLEDNSLAIELNGNKDTVINLNGFQRKNMKLIKINNES